ncbi:MAG TPA: amidohydrolase family protein, partial [Tepidisphaeraceae bacterium]|nr:amidohydrolase family protein [Tepidisphaeraceae bacterium]
MQLKITNARIVLDNEIRHGEMGIDDSKIQTIADSVGSAKQTIDADGQYVLPGVIDSHVHFNDPGRSEWEGIATGSRALAAGGGTMFIDMPLNSSPPTLDAVGFDAKLAVAQKTSLTDFALWGGLTPINLDHMEALALRGVIGFKAFMSASGIDDFPRSDDTTLKRGMQIAAQLGLLVAVHAEDEQMISRLSEEAA